MKSSSVPVSNPPLTEGCHRSIFLISLNLKVYRITVGDILNNMLHTIKKLEEYIIKNYGVINNK